MPKLRLKRTPAEEAEREYKRARKAARKAAKRTLRHGDDDDDDDSPEHRHKRPRTSTGELGDDSDSEYGPQPALSGSHRAHKPDYERIAAEVEEMRFREKLYDAMGDDERLDSVEASMNSYAHIPRRWRGGGMDRMDDQLGIDPRYMEEEDYAEWVREGMWRKKHAAEHEERMRREAERKARKEREKAIREETRRMERAAEEERRQRRRQKERLFAVEAREAYEARWKELLAPGSTVADASLRFGDVPWPVIPPAPPPSSKRVERPAVVMEDLTAEAISAFLLPPSEDVEQGDPESAKKDRKEKLRETMLRFHPDKFEGRIMRLVKASDQELVKEAVGVVARTLNTLMGEKK